MSDEINHKSDAECLAILHSIFAGYHALLTSLAPEGWGNSPYIHFFHPDAQQQLAEYNRVTDNIARFSKNANKEPRKTLADFHMDDVHTVNAQDEFTQVLGSAVWDIFSDNHEVIGPDAKVYDLGSFRGTGETIADFINENYPLSERQLDYMDFYMGSIWISGRASMLPFYEYIFAVLKQHNCNWRYSFPKMGLVQFSKEEPEDNTPENYNPLHALQNELAGGNAETNKLQEELDRIYEEEYEDAKYKPLPLTVRAYNKVYGILPDGHPQKEFE